MKTNEKGVGASLIVLILLVVALTAVVGWFVYSRQKDNSTDTKPANSAMTSKTVDSKITSSTDTQKEEKPRPVNAKPEQFYQINLPKGWETSESKDYSMWTTDLEQKYVDKVNGRELTVLVNISWYEFNFVDSINYSVANNQISIDLMKMKKCLDYSTPEFCKNEFSLRVVLSAKEDATINNNSYLFIYKDNKVNSSDSLSVMKTLIENMAF